MHRSRAWGVTTVWIGSGERPESRDGRPRVVARRPRPQSPRDRRIRVVLPPAVGADPRLFRAPGPAERARRVHRRRLYHLQRRGSPGRGADRDGRRHGHRAHRQRRRNGRDHTGRPGRRRRTGAGARGDGDQPRSRRRALHDFRSTRRAHELPVSVHRRAGRRSQIAARRPGRLGAGQGRRKSGAAPLHAGGQHRTDRQRRRRDGASFQQRRTVVHLRQRRKLHRLHHFGAVVRPAAGRQAACRRGR